MSVFRVGLITCFSIFILGYLNSHTQSVIGSFVSPQTGNLINLGLHLANGNFSRFLTGILMFFTFVLGCAIGHRILKRKHNPKTEFFMCWGLFAVPIILYFFLYEYLPINIIISALSLVSGMALCFFRKIGQIDLNNNIVTGNMRFFAAAAHDALLTRDKSRVRPFWIYGLGIFIFFLGSFACGIALRIGEDFARWLPTGILILPFILILVGGFAKRTPNVEVVAVTAADTRKVEQGKVAKKKR